jgi:hypothetical protein
VLPEFSILPVLPKVEYCKSDRLYTSIYPPIWRTLKFVPKVDVGFTEVGADTNNPEMGFL